MARYGHIERSILTSLACAFIPWQPPHTVRRATPLAGEGAICPYCSTADRTSAPSEQMVRGTRARLRRNQGTSEQDTSKPRTGPKAAAGFFSFGERRAMMKLYSQKDVDRRALKGARIAVLGYGSQ